MTEYVIYPKKGARRDKSRPVKPDPTPAGPSFPTFPTLSNASSTGTSTPEVQPVTGTSTPSTADAVKRAAALRSRMPREDGGVVCCIAVAEYCFKQGRVTVPPVGSLHLGLFVC